MSPDLRVAVNFLAASVVSWSDEKSYLQPSAGRSPTRAPSSVAVLGGLHGFCTRAHGTGAGRATRLQGERACLGLHEETPVMILSIPLKPAAAPLSAGGFTLKLFTALVLVAVADVVFDGGGRFGAASAAFAALWLVGLWLARPAMRRNTGAMVALAFAWAMTFALFEDPSALAALLFWGGVTMASLLPRSANFGDARRWARRLAFTLPAVIAMPIVDARTWAKARRRGRAARTVTLISTLFVPIVGAILFSFLFAQANPIIASWLMRSRDDLTDLDAGRVGFWIVVALVVWASLRQSKLLRIRPKAAPSSVAPPAVTAASVLLSLVTFNALFAVENALDIAFLWSGAELPKGVTLADYAHQGAYPLIATALLAGAFVLYALRPGAPGAESPTIRGLVYLWIAQNIFLVASSALRTLDYVEVYSLTRLRLAALIWMGLVAVGLALICWRILKRKSGGWLVNANVLAVLAVLSACAFVDLGEVAARWNVRRSETLATTAGLDIGYLTSLGPSSLGALVEFEDKSVHEWNSQKVAAARESVENRLATRQSDWRSWTWRGARRLKEAREAVAARQAKSPVETLEQQAPAAPQSEPASE